jgi:hypothetical protein
MEYTTTKRRFNAEKAWRLCLFTLLLWGFALCKTGTLQAQETGQILEQGTGQFSGLLPHQDINDIALEGRDATKPLNVQFQAGFLATAGLDRRQTAQYAPGDDRHAAQVCQRTLSTLEVASCS